MREPRPTVRQRQAIIDRAAGRCEYCHSPDDCSPGPFSIEHITPRAEGGSSDTDNLAWSCSGCNGHKYNKTSGVDAESQQIAPLFHPRQQRWQDHFTWNEDFTLVIGISPTGRATVATLHLNRPPLINLRRILVANKMHPPLESRD